MVWIVLLLVKVSKLIVPLPDVNADRIMVAAVGSALARVTMDDRRDSAVLCR